MAMKGNSQHGRRKFLKKAATTTAVTGGILGTAQPAAACCTQTVDINCRAGIGYYTIEVSDPNVTAKNSENDDSISRYDDFARMEGTLDASSDPTDTYEYSGHITYVEFDGYLDLVVSGDIYAWNGTRELSVYGQDADYTVQIANGSISPKEDIEPEDSTDSDSCSGTAYDGDEDIYTTDNATIEYVWAECEEPLYISHPL